MAVVGVGKSNGGNELLEAGDDGVEDMGVHEAAGAFEALGGQILTVAEQRPDPLFVDRLRPLRAEEVRDREFEQEIAQWCRVEDRGIEEGDGDRQGSVAHVQFLGVGGEFVERLAPRVVGGLLVGSQIVEPDAPVRSDLAKRNGAGLEEVD